MKLHPTLFACLLSFLLTPVGCTSSSEGSKSSTKAVKWDKNADLVSSAIIPCGADGKCAEDLTCEEIPGAACKTDDECIASQKCNPKFQACTQRGCVDTCSQNNRRYRYSDRKLLRFDKVPAGVDPWVWSSACAAEGQCTPTKSSCVSTREEDCRKSLRCSWYGQCSFKSGRCVAKSEQDCRDSRVCQQNGRCTPKSNECTATSEADCRASEKCKEYNWCIPDSDGLCRVPEGEQFNFAALHKKKPAAPAKGDKPVKIDPAAGGETVGTIFANKKTLAGKQIQVRGEVVKFNGGILGRNWIHIQDGTGSAADKTNDLLITSDETVKPGQTLTFQGRIAVDQDFGFGYHYDVLLEKATVVK